MLIKGNTMGSVLSLDYLGHKIAADDDPTTLLQSCFQKYKLTLRNLYKMFHLQHLKLNLKKVLWNCTVSQVFLHGCESWGLKYEANKNMMYKFYRVLKRHYSNKYMGPSENLMPDHIKPCEMARKWKARFLDQLKTFDEKISKQVLLCSFNTSLISFLHIPMP